jgi:membrane fusion protein, copper/silver efflux system
MKKCLYALLFVLLLVGSFLSGFWVHDKREAAKMIPSGTQSTSDKSDETPGTVTDTESASPSPGTVKVSPEKQQLIGVKVAAVEKTPWSPTVRLLGRVVPDDNRIYRINSASDGWVKKILPATTGSLVKKDELLGTFFSPEFFSGIKAYLFGLRSLDRVEASRKEPKEQIEQTSASIENYRNTLRNLGMTEYQLDEIMRTREGTDKIEIRAPAAGFILARNLSPGQRFEKGTELYRIVDLSKVWIVADIFENEAKYLHPGKKVKATLTYQKKVFQATVSDALPQFDPATRTLKVRLEADNPGYALRPDMFVDVELTIHLPPAITVPADAVLDSGHKKTVFVDQGDGLFDPREVETGWHIGNRVEIVKGLKTGEKIVTSGNFLIDSESRLQLVAAGMVDALRKDPVCGTSVSISKAEKAGRKTMSAGVMYYFCSDECKEQFDKNPARYLRTP